MAKDRVFRTRISEIMTHIDEYFKHHEIDPQRDIVVYISEYINLKEQFNNPPSQPVEKYDETEFFLEHARILIAKNKLEDAAMSIEEHCKNHNYPNKKEILDMVTITLGRYEELVSLEIKGLESSEVLGRERRQIADSLLQLLSRFK